MNKLWKKKLLVLIVSEYWQLLAIVSRVCGCLLLVACNNGGMNNVPSNSTKVTIATSQLPPNNNLIIDTCSNGVNAENGDNGNCEIDAQDNRQLLTKHAWVAKINQTANLGLYLQGFRYNVLTLTNDGKLAQYFMKDLSGDINDSNNTMQSPLANSSKTNYLPTQVNVTSDVITENTTNQTYDYAKSQYVYTQCLNNQCVFAVDAQAFNPIVIFQQDGNFVYQIPANTLCNKDNSACNSTSEVT